MKTQIDTPRVFVRWLGTIDAVDSELQVKVVSPDVTPDENSRDVKLRTFSYVTTTLGFPV